MNYLLFLTLSILAVEHLPVWVFGIAFCLLAALAALFVWFFFIPHTVPQPRRKARKQVNRYPHQFRACAVGCPA